MKTFYAYLLLLSFFLFYEKADAQNQDKGRTCGTMKNYWERYYKDAKFRGNLQKVEDITNLYIERLRKEGAAGLRSGVIKIPVVVHVVYNTTSENVSNAQIQSQINALNRDFRRLNADVSGAPSPFSGLTADTRIEFELAKRDPNCNATTGITRTSTRVTSFNYCPDCSSSTTRNPVKFNASGGRDAWPADQYLNIWVCDLAGFLGYASFPADLAARPNEDGIVIDYQYFGTIGTATAPFNLGRTGTHEVGHWLNLRHIWGDDGPGTPLASCAGSDFVDDTPNQDDPNFACPAFPTISCMNDPNGDMFINYMDYVDDNCMIMFSQGQSERMAATMFGVRASILASDALVPPAGVPGADLWSQDTPEDTGSEPNTASPRFYRSDDIWVRNSNDGLTNQEHQNPVYKSSGEPNYVYVRIRNRGCSSPQSGEVKLYWAKASSGLSWPSPWDGSITSPALMGDPIGSQSVTVNADDYQILVFPWVVPNPADYSSFGADRTHFCLLSRIETSSTPPFGMTIAETSNLGANVQNNNNIVWKNVTVNEMSTGGGRSAIIVGNYSKAEMLVNLNFEIPRKKGEPSIFDYGYVVVNLGEFGSRWKPQTVKGIEIVNEKEFIIHSPYAETGYFYLKPHEFFTIDLQFVLKKKPYTNTVFELNMNQIDAKSYKFIGGETFIMKYKVDNFNQKQTETPGTQADLLVSAQNESLISRYGIKLYPNPNEGAFTIQAIDLPENQVLAAIYDISGKQIYQEKLEAPAGKLQKSLAVPKLEPGVYILHLKLQDETVKYKFFIK